MQTEAVQTLSDAWETGVNSAGPLLFRNLSLSTRRTADAEAVPATRAATEKDLQGAIEAAREEGRRDGAAALRDDMERRVSCEREQVSSALEAFFAEKRKYFAGIEKEVVRLALAIAERVLHRETTMDPTLLAGAARVVLEQVDQDSTATLLVAPEDIAQWRAAVSTLGREVTLREENSLQRGECLLQTGTGSFELGLRAQLAEIERGFFELMGRRSAVTP